jgi:hypothetical protein
MAQTGKVGMAEQDVDAVFASYLIRLKIIDNAVAPFYLLCFVLSDTYRGYITGASTGTTRKSASAGVVTRIDMQLPPRDMLLRFEEQVVPLRGLLTALVQKNVSYFAAPVTRASVGKVRHVLLGLGKKALIRQHNSHPLPNGACHADDPRQVLADERDRGRAHG